MTRDWVITFNMNLTLTNLQIHGVANPNNKVFLGVASFSQFSAHNITFYNSNSRLFIVGVTPALMNDIKFENVTSVSSLLS